MPESCVVCEINVRTSLDLQPVGVSQGGVLSPFLFVIFIDDVIRRRIYSNLGCNISPTCAGIVVCADDILLMTPSVHTVLLILSICERKLISIDMCLNVKIYLRF